MTFKIGQQVFVKGHPEFKGIITTNPYFPIKGSRVAFENGAECLYSDDSLELIPSES